MQKEIIQKLCRQLRLGSHISEVYSEIEASSNEDFLIKILNEAVRSREIERRNRYIQCFYRLIMSVDSRTIMTQSYRTS
jgi:hypothetical protein